MTDDELKEIEVRCQAATPGPWRWGSGKTTWGEMEPEDSHERKTLEYLPGAPSDGPVVRQHDAEGDIIFSIEEGWVYDAKTEANKAFIAHSRQDVEWLIAEVRRLSAPEIAKP